MDGRPHTAARLVFDYRDHTERKEAATWRLTCRFLCSLWLKVRCIWICCTLTRGWFLA
jgi:hypothetical protein